VDVKSTVDQIRERFDKDIERFSHLETGNTAQVDSVLSLELIAEAAKATTPLATSLLDVGCGAGNYSLKILEKLPALDVTLLDLSQPMLQRAPSARLSRDSRLGPNGAGGHPRRRILSSREFSPQI
jgi:tRNA (cmo5U34)-methyltransferase